ncbi:MAG: alpha/beta hydrolase [Cyanobacteria bacterium REEB67]|nr:alpha/beta hydrolase [Cyanobacteria bacterium REEB67]
MDNTNFGEHFALQTPKGHLTASLHFPPHRDRYDAREGKELIVMLHGFSGTRYETYGLFEKAAAHFAHHGYHVLRFDFRGCGDSHGTSMDVYPSAQIEDTFWAIEYVTALPELRGLATCHLLGFSFGGVVAALSASARPEMFRTLTIWEGPFNLGRELKRAFEPIDYDALWAQGYLANGDSRLNAHLFYELDHLDLAASLSSYSGPVLVISGTADDIVPFQPNHQEWLEHLRNAQLSEALIKGADHGFTGDAQRCQAVDVTTQFLARYRPGQ